MAEQQREPGGPGEHLEFARAARGAILLPTLPPPTDNDPLLRAVLEEIPQRLGVPFLSPIFLALASWPDYLVAAWSAYSPLIDTPRYRAAIADISVDPGILESVQPAPDRPHDHTELTEYLQLQRSLLPELLLLASTWYHSGSGGGSPSVAVEAPVPVRPRAVRRAAVPASPDDGLEPLLEALAAAHGHPRVLSVYRTIGGAPGFLAGAAPELLRIIGTPSYDAARRRLLDQSARAAERVAMPATLSAHEGPLEILALFRNVMIPALVLDTAILGTMLERADPEETNR